MKLSALARGSQSTWKHQERILGCFQEGCQQTNNWAIKPSVNAHADCFLKADLINNSLCQRFCLSKIFVRCQHLLWSPLMVVSLIFIWPICHFSFIKPFLCTVEINLVSLSDFWLVEGINAELRHLCHANLHTCFLFAVHVNKRLLFDVRFCYPWFPVCVCCLCVLFESVNAPYTRCLDVFL